jgi:hypothetical protein
MYSNRSWPHPDKFEYSCRPLNDPLPAATMTSNISSPPPRIRRQGDNGHTVQITGWLHRTKYHADPWDDLPLSEAMTSSITIGGTVHDAQRVQLSYPLVEPWIQPSRCFPDPRHELSHSFRTMNLVITASPLRYVPVTSGKRMDPLSQMIYFCLIIFMAPQSCIR